MDSKADPLAPNSADQQGPCFDPWLALGFSRQAYGSAVDLLAIAVLRAIDEGLACGDIADRLDLSPDHVDLFQTMFTAAGWCVVEIKPCGCRINPAHGEDFGARLIAAWEEYHRRRWNG